MGAECTLTSEADSLWHRNGRQR